MGSQQIIYIVLSIALVVLLGSAGYNIFREYQKNHSRDLLVHEIQRFYTSAIEFSKKPAQMNGGGGSYLNWKPEYSLSLPDIGVIKYKSFDDRINFLATGKVTGNDDSTSVKVLVKYRKSKEPLIRILN